MGRIAPKGATNSNKLNAQERDRERERERDRGDRDRERERDDEDSVDQSATRVAGEIMSGSHLQPHCLVSLPHHTT